MGAIIKSRIMASMLVPAEEKPSNNRSTADLGVSDEPTPSGGEGSEPFPARDRFFSRSDFSFALAFLPPAIATRRDASPLPVDARRPVVRAALTRAPVDTSQKRKNDPRVLTRSELGTGRFRCDRSRGEVARHETTEIRRRNDQTKRSRAAVRDEVDAGRAHISL